MLIIRFINNIILESFFVNTICADASAKNGACSAGKRFEQNAVKLVGTSRRFAKDEQNKQKNS